MFLANNLFYSLFLNFFNNIHPMKMSQFTTVNTDMPNKIEVK